MKKYISILLIMTLCLNFGFGIAFASDLSKEEQIDMIAKQKDEILKSINRQLELQDKSIHYSLYEEIIEYEYKSIKEKINKNNVSKESVSAYSGGEVSYDMKSIDWGYVDVDVTFFDPSDTISILDGLETHPLISLGNLIGSYFSALAEMSPAITKTLGFLGFSYGAYNLYTSTAIREINRTQYTTSKVTHVVDQDGIRSSVVYAWYTYPSLDIPTEDGYIYKNVTYKIY